MRSSGWRIPVVLALLAALACVQLASARSEPPRPDIVLILTDDQRWDSLWAMPNVRRLLVSHGVRFSHAYVSNPVCCPSRASILTGRYSHATGVYWNAPPNGGFPAFDDSSTVATWLSGAGYSTALIGKYLNLYSSARVGTYIPPGWTRWVAFSRMQNGGGAYYDYQLNIDGHLRDYGFAPYEYSTKVLARQAVSFIDNATGPLFLYLAPSAPHYPEIPAPRYQDAFSDLPRWRPPSYNEADVSDKPLWLQSLPRLGLQARAQTDSLRRKQYRTLLSVDDAVGRIVQALADTGRLHNTMIVFMSDNGYLWGEHRWNGKVVPYDESVRVPMIVRYDPLTTVAHGDPHLVLNIDLAPTFAELAGTSAPGVEGHSLLPLLQGTNAGWRTGFLIEHAGGTKVPAYCGVHTRRTVYVKYSTGEEELYDLHADPYELSNQAGDPSDAPLLAQMRSRLAALCEPPPPGVTP